MTARNAKAKAASAVPLTRWYSVTGFATLTAIHTIRVFFGSVKLARMRFSSTTLPAAAITDVIGPENSVSPSGDVSGRSATRIIVGIGGQTSPIAPRWGSREWRTLWASTERESASRLNTSST